MRTFKYLYLKLFRTNDTPQRTACGFGIGIFLGIMPGLGPLAGLIAASLFRVNKAAAVVGALLTNTWTSLLTAILSIKIGAGIMHLNWQELYSQWRNLLSDFHWRSLLQSSFLEILIPVLVGYLVIAAIFGLTAYLIIFLILSAKKAAKKVKTKASSGKTE